ncbi:MAG: HK97 gp10 family phage protein [Gammaproteobacteria bacterium]|nr:HK97 gp10 family phage protein [Gammaproteobacteria bacterium]MCP5013820.1 HK97 gp10 family phage protein [Ketobacter sp.]
MPFADQVAKFSLNTKAGMDDIERGIIFKMASSLIDMSPVGDPDLWKGKPPPGYVGGRFRGNWQIGIGEPATGTIDAVDASGGATKNKLAAAVEKITAGGVTYITNNLPYAIPLEYGHSTQAPSGMVRITIARFKAIAKQVIDANK